jgi:hypothetical protein
MIIAAETNPEAIAVATIEEGNPILLPNPAMNTENNNNPHSVNKKA